MIFKIASRGFVTAAQREKQETVDKFQLINEKMKNLVQTFPLPFHNDLEFLCELCGFFFGEKQPQIVVDQIFPNTI